MLTDKSVNTNDDSVPKPRPPVTTNRRGLIGVIHVGTSTVYFSVYSTTDFKQLLSVQEEIQLLMPQDGWFEQDPMEIMSAVYQCCSDLCAMLGTQGQKQEDIICIAVTNQRETTVLWNSDTGEPLHRAIVWNDIRTSQIADSISGKLSAEKKEALKKLSGLPISPYFSALKMRWLIENEPEVRKAMKRGICKAGTLDSWIVWNLTKGKLHITDVTNASRTMLMNIQTLTWDPELLRAFGVDGTILPQIRSSSEIYGRITASRSVLKEVFICGIIGDQQASLVGQMCVERGQANCNYNVGCFLLCNTGLQRIMSKHGLLTTVAYKMGPNARAVYALEGSVAVGGRAFDWLATKLQILPNADEAESYAKAVPTTAGLYFVPAFTGLYAPHWVKSARGIMIGLTGYHTSKHIVRAAHEAICYQTYDILECMRNECGITPNVLYADGKLATNKTLMQLQADISGLSVMQSQRTDRSSLGAAICAAHAFSFDLSVLKTARGAAHTTFTPANTSQDREMEYRKWHRAIERSKGWTAVEKRSKFGVHKVLGKFGVQRAVGPWWLYLLVALLLFAILLAIAYIYLEDYHPWRKLPVCPLPTGRQGRRIRRRGL